MEVRSEFPFVAAMSDGHVILHLVDHVMELSGALRRRTNVETRSVDDRGCHTGGIVRSNVGESEGRGRSSVVGCGLEGSGAIGRAAEFVDPAGGEGVSPREA